MADTLPDIPNITETVSVQFVADAAAKSGAALIFASSAKDDELDRLYPGANLVEAAKASKFDGKAGQSLTSFANGVRVIVQGSTPTSDSDQPFDYEMAAAKTAKSLKGSGVTTLTIHIVGEDISPVMAARAAVGARLASYSFDRNKSKATLPKVSPLKSVRVATPNAKDAQTAYNNYYGPVGDGIIFARDLVNEPPNILFPKSYADRIKALKDQGLKIEVLGEAKMEKLGMNALLGVGKGSERESQLVIMRWDGGTKGDKPAMLVGKGVTFDSGGISLKPGANMWDMRGDMGGSAAVVGTMLGLARRKAKSNVIGIVGLVENMPDGRAQNPGDVVTSMSGQTIEVQNTDAEGRLVLADALHYGIDRFEPKAVIDLATLTGAIIISLGHEYAGLFSNDDGLAEQLVLAGEASTDKVWRLPLGKPYDKLLNSSLADMKNIGGRAAGSITAAQFLQRFVKKGTSWAHLDIAGTGMKPSGRHDPRESTFGTGFGVRLLNRWIAENHEG